MSAPPPPNDNPLPDPGANFKKSETPPATALGSPATDAGAPGGGQTPPVDAAFIEFQPKPLDGIPRASEFPNDDDGSTDFFTKPRVQMELSFSPPPATNPAPKRQRARGEESSPQPSSVPTLPFQQQLPGFMPDTPDS